MSVKYQCCKNIVQSSNSCFQIMFARKTARNKTGQPLTMISCCVNSTSSLFKRADDEKISMLQQNTTVGMVLIIEGGRWKVQLGLRAIILIRAVP